MHPNTCVWFFFFFWSILRLQKPKITSFFQDYNRPVYTTDKKYSLVLFIDVLQEILINSLKKQQIMPICIEISLKGSIARLKSLKFLPSWIVKINPTVVCSIERNGFYRFFLILSQTTNFRHFHTERVCRQPFQIRYKWLKVLQRGKKTL